MTDSKPPPFVWPAPVIPGRWRELGRMEALTLAARIGQALGPDDGMIVWHAELHNLRATPLTFYRDWLLVEVAVRLESQTRYSHACFLYGPGMRLVLLDLSSGPIHAVNEQHLLPLATADVAADYLRFFCNFITGDEGRFRIVEAPAQVPWQSGAEAAGHAAHADSIVPVQVERIEKPGAQHAWRAHATMLYGDTLFRASYEIAGDGSILMVADEPLGTLQVRPEILTPPFRMQL